MSRSYRNYTDEDIIKHASEAKNMSDLLKRLGLRVAGGNFNNMRRKLQSLGLECDHWQGQAWNKDKRLKDWSKYTKLSSLKPHLIKERGHACERCGLSEWQDQPITLEVDHVDGDRTNNELSNLKLNCPNCHALTPTWRGRKATE